MLFITKSLHTYSIIEFSFYHLVCYLLFGMAFTLHALSRNNKICCIFPLEYNYTGTMLTQVGSYNTE